jgi:hypothetical protein
VTGLVQRHLNRQIDAGFIALMNASSEFDEKEFWLELFSIVARRETTRENEQPVQSIRPEGAIEPQEGSESKEQICYSNFW